MNVKTVITLSMFATMLMASDVSAQATKERTPAQEQAQSMQGHDMSKMQRPKAEGEHAPGHDMAAMKGHSAGSMELHRIMAQSGEMPMPMSGDVDKDFATMMTMHHQQAIKMSDVLIQHGQNAELKAMAEKMKADQQKEIGQLAPHAK